MTNEEILKTLQDTCETLSEYLRENPVFRSRPCGAPFSEVRTQQEHSIETEDKLKAYQNEIRVAALELESKQKVMYEIEALLGNNVMYLNDALAPALRVKDERTIQCVEDIENAWKLSVTIIK